MEKNPTLVRVVLVGLGNVGTGFLRILSHKAALLTRRYGLDVRVTAVADSRGLAVDPAGFDPAVLIDLKRSGAGADALPGFQPDRTVAGAIPELPCDLVIDAAPVNLDTGEPGLSIVRAALENGIDTILADKGPLVLAYAELSRLAEKNGAALAFSATVCGPLPVINCGQRDFVAADIHLFRGVLNATTNFILESLAQGKSYREALQTARDVGAAEADPRLDVEGWDTANKLVIVANSVLETPVTIEDISVQGITGLNASLLEAHKKKGETVKLLAVAEKTDGQYRFSVGPVALTGHDFLAACNGWEMGVEFHSDIYGPMYFKTWEREPGPTAAAVLRDAINISRRF
jgi:homoserine dehydrogenase